MNDEDKVPGREEALLELVKACAQRPFDEETVLKARTTVVEGFGEGTLVEGAVCLAFFEGMTKITDATGKKPVSGLMWTMMFYVFTFIRFLFELWRRFLLLKR